MQLDAIHVKHIEINGSTYKVEVVYDQDPDSPRDWSPIGRMICSHKRYKLGDDVDRTGMDLIRTFSQYDGWDEVENHIYDVLNAKVVLPLYLYDHSGISISTKPFSCSWDSGQIGFIYCTTADILQFTLSKEWDDSLVETATRRLESEVQIYNQYLNGEVYGYRITDSNQEHVDSCYGYYGNPEECLEEAILELKAQLKLSA